MVSPGSKRKRKGKRRKMRAQDLDAAAQDLGAAEQEFKDRAVPRITSQSVQCQKVDWIVRKTLAQKSLLSPKVGV